MWNLSDSPARLLLLAGIPAVPVSKTGGREIKSKSTTSSPASSHTHLRRSGLLSKPRSKKKLRERRIICFPHCWKGLVFFIRLDVCCGLLVYRGNCYLPFSWICVSYCADFQRTVFFLDLCITLCFCFVLFCLTTKETSQALGLTMVFITLSAVKVRALLVEGVSP